MDQLLPRSYVKEMTVEVTVPIPVVLRVLPEYVPVDLVGRDQWVVWRWSWNGCRAEWTKPPFQPRTGQLASATNPITWSSFPVAIAAYRSGGWDGLGFVLKRDDPFTGIDLDRCRDTKTGQVAPHAKEIVEHFASYAEASPSGTGVRIWITGSLIGLLPGDKAGIRRGSIEIYSGGRYLTVTGHHLIGNPILPIHERQVQLAALVSRTLGPLDLSRRAPVTTLPLRPSTVTEEEVIARARAARNGAKFTRLFDHGDIDAYDGDDSRADQALLSLLAFWTQDPAQLDRLFRRSGLYRAKWERPDYRERTIARALVRGEVFTPSAWRGGRSVSIVPEVRGRRGVIDLSLREGQRVR